MCLLCTAGGVPNSHEMHALMCSGWGAARGAPGTSKLRMHIQSLHACSPSSICLEQQLDGQTLAKQHAPGTGKA